MSPIRAGPAKARQDPVATTTPYTSKRGTGPVAATPAARKAMIVRAVTATRKARVLSTRSATLPPTKPRARMGRNRQEAARLTKNSLPVAETTRDWTPTDSIQLPTLDTSTLTRSMPNDDGSSPPAPRDGPSGLVRAILLALSCHLPVLGVPATSIGGVTDRGHRASAPR